MAELNLGKVVGSQWYTGTGVTGTSTTGTAFSGSGVESAIVGDMYLNTSTSNIYQCTASGAASVAKWKYIACIKGMPGSAGKDGSNGTNGAAAGFGTPTATVDSGTGTPSVTVTASGGNTSKVFAFAFKNLKGAPGAAGKDGADGKTPSLSINANGELVATFA